MPRSPVPRAWWSQKLREQPVLNGCRHAPRLLLQRRRRVGSAHVGPPPFPGELDAGAGEGKETLALHAHRLRQNGASYLFESSWKKPYSDRGVRRLLERYARAAGLAHPISPHRLRHFLLTWLKKQGIDDALIQPYSGHASRQSLEIYSRLAIAEAQAGYDEVIRRFPV
jgi:integrase